MLGDLKHLKFPQISQLSLLLEITLSLTPHTYCCTAADVDVDDDDCCTTIVQAGHLAECYWMSLARDVPFSEYGENELTIAAAGILFQRNLMNERVLFFLFKYGDCLFDGREHFNFVRSLFVWANSRIVCCRIMEDGNALYVFFVFYLPSLSN